MTRERFIKLCMGELHFVDYKTAEAIADDVALANEKSRSEEHKFSNCTYVTMYNALCREFLKSIQENPQRKIWIETDDKGAVLVVGLKNITRE